MNVCACPYLSLLIPKMKNLAAQSPPEKETSVSLPCPHKLTTQPYDDGTMHLPLILQFTSPVELQHLHQHFKLFNTCSQHMWKYGSSKEQNQQMVTPQLHPQLQHKKTHLRAITIELETCFISFTLLSLLFLEVILAITKMSIVTPSHYTEHHCLGATNVCACPYLSLLIPKMKHLAVHSPL
jgi:hypothetical protein